MRIAKAPWPTPLLEQLDQLLAKPLAEVTAADFVRVVKMAQALLAEKKKARLEKSGRAPDRVLMRDAMGNEFPFQLARIGWEVGDTIPVKIDLTATNDPRVTRVYRLTRGDDWHGRLVYEEIL